MQTYSVSVLEALEAESIHLLREIAGEFERPAIAESEGPRFSALERLAASAFAPGAVPFPVVRADGAGHDALIVATGGDDDPWNIYNGRIDPLARWTDTDVERFLGGDTGGEDAAAERLSFVLAGDAGAGKSTLLKTLSRHFAAARRRLLAMDIPAGEQALRELVRGASRAELAVIVLDAEQGLVPEARRHAFLCSLLGIPRLAVAVNKIDRVPQPQQRFHAIRHEFEGFAARLAFKSLTFIPVSATHGDNVAAHSRTLPWYDGATLLEHLERAYTGGDRNLVDLRLPVQYVARAGAERWLCGQIASGVLKAGDEIVIVPSHQRSRVRAIAVGERRLEYAYAPLSVALLLEDDVDVRRGATIAHPRNVPRGVRELESMVVWMDGQRLEQGRVYLLKLGASRVRASCAEVAYRMDAQTLHRANGGGLAAGDIGRANFTLFEERFVDPHARNRTSGAFLVADAASGRTLGVGVIVDRETERERLEREEAAKRHVIPVLGKVSGDERTQLLRQRAATVWLTGLSGSGKSTLATELEKRLIASGHACFMLDGDNVRAGINRDLGFGPEDRRENIRRIAEVARLMNDAGLIVVTAFISPYRADRAMARAIAGPERFLEVHVRAPLEVCEQRDPKGLYAKARRGEIAEFTGISAPYEAPESPEILLETAERSVGQCVEQLLKAVLEKTRI